MKLFQLAVVTIVLPRLANASPVNLSNISTCAASCILQTFSAANCSLFDSECQCNNQALAYSTSTCLLQQCSLADTVAVGKLQDETCGRTAESRQKPMLIVNLTMGILSTLVVALRLLSRTLITKMLWADDYLILSALAVNVPSIACGAWMQLNGLGQHTWYIPVPRIPIVLRLFYISETLYLLVLTLVKVSILVSYLRIFPRRRFRIATYATLGFILLAGILIMLLQIFQCFPISYNWDRSLKTGKCLNVNVLSYTHAGISVLQDFIILILPLPELSQLKMERKQKIGLIFVFQIGLFACITSIVRLHALTQFDGTKTVDPTWDNVNATIWTSIEINIAIICCSLPALRPLLRAIFATDLGASHTAYPTLKRSRTTVSSRKTGDVVAGQTSSDPSSRQPDNVAMRSIGSKMPFNKPLPPLPLTPRSSLQEDGPQPRPTQKGSEVITYEDIELLTP